MPAGCRACAQQYCCGPFAGWDGERSLRGLECLRGCVRTAPTPETRSACDSNCANLFPQGIAGARAAFECLNQRCAEGCAP